MSKKYEEEEVGKRLTVEQLVGKLKEGLNDFFFPGLPEHYSLRKKLTITKANSVAGTLWDTVQIGLAVLVCVLYVLRSYPLSLDTSRSIYNLEVVITQFFLFDFLLELYLATPTFGFFFDFYTIIDILTILPVYLAFGLGSEFVALNFLRCLRILRLMKTFKTFRLVRNASGVRRQLIYLALTLISLVFLSSGIIQLLENDVQQHEYACKYINADTSWLPSCTPNAPETAPCDCSSNLCSAYFRYTDKPGQPQGIYCSSFTYFDSFYYIIVTFATVGYGDIHPTTIYAKVFIIFFVFGSFVIIPMRINELQQLLSLRSPFRTPYYPISSENHVIVCGHVNDVAKLERFFSEFYHPDRMAGAGEEYHTVILSPYEPTEEVLVLLQCQALDSKVTYVIGSALATEDLKRVRADIAFCMFFLCNTEIKEGMTNAEDAATVLRALSVSNFNPDLECLVQVLRPEERTILKDSDVNVVLCLDEFKTALQARNAVCPGFSTFVENIFTSVEGVSDEMEKTLPPWYKEYLRGAGMELYFVCLDLSFLEVMRYSFKRIAEAIYIEYDCIVLGVCNEAKTSVVFNPDFKDLSEFKNVKEFMVTYNVALIMADDQQQADQIAEGLADPEVVRRIHYKMEAEEDAKPCWKRVSSQNYKLGFAPNAMKPKKSGLGLKMDSLFKGPLSSKPSANNKETRKHTSDAFSDEESDADDEEDERLNEENYIGYAASRFKGPQSPSAAAKGGPGSASTLLARPDQATATKNLSSSFNDEEAKSPSRPLKSVEPLEGPPITAPSSAKKIIFAGSKAANRLSKRSQSGKNSPLQITASDGSDDNGPWKLGSPSAMIEDCFRIREHIVVYGCDAYLSMFLSELRRPAVRGETYHPIVVVSEEVPTRWESICAEYNDVFLLLGNLTRNSVFSRINIEHTFAMIFLSARDSVTRIDDEESVDAVTLFAYLKLEQRIPKRVFCSVELNSASNMAVLNSTLMRRMRRVEVEEGIERARLLNEQVTRPAPPPITLGAAETTTQSSEWTRPTYNRGRRGSALGSEGRFAQGVAGGSSSGASGASPSIVVPPVKERAKQVRRTSLNMMTPEAIRNQEHTRYLHEKTIWETLNTHHVYPVFASARAFVPSSFETLLVQSFYVKLTPILCEKFVCGQLAQTVMQVQLPDVLIGKRFMDLFRLFMQHKVLAFGLYRAPQKTLGATLPYVFVSPPFSCILNEGDKIFVFGTVLNLARACKANFRTDAKVSFSTLS